MVIIFVRKWLMKRLIFSFALVLVGVQPVGAQDGTGCPNGETATGPRSPANPLGCVPNPQAQNGQSAQPRGRWETRWGAYAIDGAKGRLGAVASARTKKQAVKAAIVQCRLNGGADGCKKATFSYFNQCVAVAWGDATYRGSSRATLDEATKDTMQSCNNATSNCKIVYADCSLPVWVE
jgi:hypothetical protein